MIRIKRIYDPPDPSDGARFLVDRLWPRGVKKEAIPPGAWLREVAPSDKLRRRFAHDPARWEEFRRMYSEELDAHRALLSPLLEVSRRGVVTLLYAARDREHNNAAALRSFLESKLQR